MCGAVIFDPVVFIQRFPQFASVGAPTLHMYFDEAALHLNNTDRSRVRDLGERATLLGLLTAHIGTLSGVLTPAGAGSTATQVGRVSSAGEGSVSVSLDMGATPGTGAYFLQTQYGASYWQLTAKYRTMRYIPPRRR